jgi:acyl carrier protein phosphodiesterase
MVITVNFLNNGYQIVNALNCCHMNYLAHAYLSFGDADILVGNVISDFIKGKAKFSYPQRIQDGIFLHRQIDSFTDSHLAIKEAKEVFRPAYRLYSAPLVDILLDHFLANDKTIFPGAELESFTKNVYRDIEGRTMHLPPRFLHVFTYMQSENWLLGYSRKDGMEKSLRGLVRRATYINDSSVAYQLFLSHYELLGELYRIFFPDVKRFAKDQFEGLAS